MRPPQVTLGGQDVAKAVYRLATPDIVHQVAPVFPVPYKSIREVIGCHRKQKITDEERHGKEQEYHQSGGTLPKSMKLVRKCLTCGWFSYFHNRVRISMVQR